MFARGRKPEIDRWKLFLTCSAVQFSCFLLYQSMEIGKLNAGSLQAVGKISNCTLCYGVAVLGTNIEVHYCPGSNCSFHSTSLYITWLIKRKLLKRLWVISMKRYFFFFLAKQTNLPVLWLDHSTYDASASWFYEALTLQTAFAKCALSFNHIFTFTHETSSYWLRKRRDCDFLP